MNGALWLAPALAPLVILLALALPRVRGLALGLAPWAAVPALAIAALAPNGTADFPWLLLGARLGLDPAGRAFLGITGLVWLCAGLFAAGPRRSDRERTRFFIFYLATLSGNLGLIVALDAATFQLGYALMGFAAYGLVVHDRTPAAFRAGRIYLIFVVLSDVALFTGAALLYPAIERPLLEDIAVAAGVGPAGGAALPLLLIGFAIKAGVIPLHLWMPVTYTAAPPAASAVLAGAMINAGLLGWLRVLPFGGVALPAVGRVCIVAGLVSAFVGVVAGVVQRHPKAALAYSSISHMGLLAVGVGGVLAAPEGAPFVYTALVLYGIHHGLVKGAFFLGVGLTPAARTRRQRVTAAGGLLVLALALVGAPLTGGAVAKNALKHSLEPLSMPWAERIELLWPLATLGTALVTARVLFLAWRDAGESGDARAGQWWSWLVLVGAALTAGWWLPDVRGMIVPQ